MLKQFLSEYLKKMRLRPLLVPAVMLFLILSVYTRFYEPNVSTSFDKLDVYILSKTCNLDDSIEYVGYAKEIGKIRLVTDQEYDLGDKIHAKGYLSEPQSASDPGTFDYRDYLKRKGIFYKLVIDDAKITCRNPIGTHISKFRYFIRDKVFYIVAKVTSEKDRGLLCALCLGDTSLIDDETKRDFSLAGCSHLLAVSGTHFSSFLLIVQAMTKNIPRKNRNLIRIMFILVIGSLTGWTESVTRAAFMSICTVRSKESISGMCFAAIVMMIADPYSCRSMGFLMSFGATIGIFSFSGKIVDLLERLHIHKSVASLVASSLASKFALLPFYIENGVAVGFWIFFYQIISILIVQFVCIAFLPGVLLSLISSVFMYPCIVSARLVRFLSSLGADAYFDSFLLRPDHKVLMLLSFVILISFLFFRKHVRFVFAICFILMFVFSIDLSTKVVFLDVGQGDSCLIISEDSSILIDGGTFEEGERVLPDVLDHYKIKEVDIAIFSHLDEDHRGGIDYLYSIGRVRDIYAPADDGKGLKTMKRGDRLEVSNIDIDVLWPLSNDNVGANDDSLVLELTCNDCKILFTGDISSEVETRLTQDNFINDIDILKVAHHGSKYSSDIDFLNACEPENAVISVALYNSYGHPSKEVIDKLGEVGANIYETSKKGAIIVKITRRDYSISCIKE
ncbi:MAG: DNA internalization-related competence protein ComEC/Rec2 [Clostridiales bacterium]|nr:DNA internalization-related competence protein ComEC/Rec2 [Clostridiales bacterium]